MARLVWTERSLADLESLLQYIEKDSPAAAVRLAQRINQGVERLEQFPLLGAVVPEDDSATYREILQGSYRIIYRTDGDAVYLVALHHAARLFRPEDLP